MTQVNLSMKQTHRYREQTCGCQGGGGRLGKDGLGVWDWQVLVIIRRMDKQKNPKVLL